MTFDATPFSHLTPDTVIEAVESLGHYCDGRILTLNSYENRVYRVGIEDRPPVIAKFYRPGRWNNEAILEEHAFAHSLKVADIPVVAPLEFEGQTLFHHQDYRFALFPVQGGHAPELDDAATLVQLGRTLARLHSVGARQRYQHRPSISVERLGREPLRYLLQSDCIPDPLRLRFKESAENLLVGIEDALDALGPYQTLRLHGDCHLGNLLWREGHVHFVDLDDSVNGPAIQDLWMLLSGNENEQAWQLEQLLEGYSTFRDFDWNEVRLIEPLRSLRLLHYHAWIARRWQDAAFPRAFPDFGTPRYWSEALLQLDEQRSALGLT